MERRRLGRTGIEVSALSLGTMNFGSAWHGARPVGERAASSMLDAAIDAGVNLVDTADVYGLGASEEMLGRLLRRRRAKVLLATKVCGAMRPGDPSSGGLSARRIAEALDASLRRLKTDHVDLYMAHAPDPAVPIDETLEAFGRAVAAGKARVIGCSNFSPEQLKKALTSAGGSRPRLEFNQVQFSLAARFIEADLAPVCRREGVSVLAWSPLGGGFLTGKYAGPRRPAGRRRDPRGAFPELPEARLAGLVEVLGKVARAEGVSSAQAALGWVVAQPWVASAVVGASGPAQLAEDLAARPPEPARVSILSRASALCLG
ncbi:MAG: aldo/keto reductase [Elusimicrobia bacterium]|nr:aldo/keto reductase [Elusimicrobiota bacterium]